MGGSMSRTGDTLDTTGLPLLYDVRLKRYLAVVPPHVRRTQEELAVQLERYPFIRTGSARAILSCYYVNEEHMFVADRCVSGMTHALYFTVLRLPPGSEEWYHCAFQGSLEDLVRKYADKFRCFGGSWIMEPPPNTLLPSPARQELHRGFSPTSRHTLMSLPREIRSMILLWCIDDPVYIVFDFVQDPTASDIAPASSKSSTSVLAANDATTRALLRVSRRMHEEVSEELAVLRRKMPKVQMLSWSSTEQHNVSIAQASSTDRHDLILWSIRPLQVQQIVDIVKQAKIDQEGLGSRALNITAVYTPTYREDHLYRTRCEDHPLCGLRGEPILSRNLGIQTCFRLVALQPLGQDTTTAGGGQRCQFTKVIEVYSHGSSKVLACTRSIRPDLVRAVLDKHRSGATVVDQLMWHHNNSSLIMDDEAAFMDSVL